MGSQMDRLAQSEAVPPEPAHSLSWADVRFAFRTRQSTGQFGGSLLSLSATADVSLHSFLPGGRSNSSKYRTREPRKFRRILLLQQFLPPLFSSRPWPGDFCCLLGRPP